ncbi:MAG: UDP-N-acetylmuramoyl-L-alanyl-D-glutamate--2,6-diaminopimelate ligase [Bacteroidales bacterium]|jgi:UDP-N-acetylmuramoyl-L-alanyl-D-glutamate--2,6-diaminopimelate ligase|nr:UDP-N-acetylmuramoyl-L-alanyl-D-glutamate--2,6-diaminopimelate ligase [Bacteroidales bacterium]
MKTLSDLIKNIEILNIVGVQSKQISAICFDSRKVKPDSIFIAQNGTELDGHKYIEQSINGGAVVIVCENIPLNIHTDITYIQVKDSNLALGIIASAFYDEPTSKLKVIGITGTNGKTTTVTLLYNLFMSLGYKVGLISTIINRINYNVLPASHTTPDAIELQYLFAQMVEADCQYVFMEVSSHAIVQHRISGINFFGGIFSNITHDHLDYHKTFAAYRDAKKTFFDLLPATAFCLINIDDKNGLFMAQNTKAKIFTYTINQIASFKASIIENTLEGLLLNINGIDVSTKLVGRFNAYNILAVFATSVICGISKEETLIGISKLDSPDGRFNTFHLRNGSTAIVDYAHTPDALANVLSTIRDIVNNDSKIITVIGCGGNRDKTKRPEMADIADKGSDTVIITTDNPRKEKPEDIISDMLAGITNDDNVLVIQDRASAIKTACHIATSKDIVVIAGKGHETYQEIDGIKHHFDDKEEVLKYC